jgi:hypothetical protein
LNELLLDFCNLSATERGEFSFDPTGNVIVADLVVASAGDDKKISLWRKNGQSMGTIPVFGTDSGDNIEVI